MDEPGTCVGVGVGVGVETGVGAGVEVGVGVEAGVGVGVGVGFGVAWVEAGVGVAMGAGGRGRARCRAGCRGRRRNRRRTGDRDRHGGERRVGGADSQAPLATLLGGGSQEVQPHGRVRWDRDVDRQATVRGRSCSSDSAAVPGQLHPIAGGHACSDDADSGARGSHARHGQAGRGGLRSQHRDHERRDQQHDGQRGQPVAEPAASMGRRRSVSDGSAVDPLRSIPKHSILSPSAARLASRAPWLCGPASRRVCHLSWRPAVPRWSATRARRP